MARSLSLGLVGLFTITCMVAVVVSGMPPSSRRAPTDSVIGNSGTGAHAYELLVNIVAVVAWPVRE